MTAANPCVIRPKHSLVKKNMFHAKYRLRVPSAPFGPQQRGARRGLTDVKSARKRFVGVENRGPAAVGDCGAEEPRWF